MMCKYAVLRDKKDSLIRAAIKAECPNMKAIWIHKAEKIQEKIDSLSDKEAMEIIN